MIEPSPPGHVQDGMVVADDELMSVFQGGGNDAFCELVDRYQRPLVRFFMLRGRGAEEAEDCAQDVWRKIFRARHDYTARAQFRTYLFRVARNHLIDRMRTAEARHPWLPFEEETAAGAMQGCADAARDGDPIDHAAARELLERVHAALERLPEAQREVFTLAHLDELTYDEAADVLGVPVGTIKSRMFHAVRRLRELLKAEVG
jgi:RNA polymerase sigma-70 factor, ECF subfamily